MHVPVQHATNEKPNNDQYLWSFHNFIWINIYSCRCQQGMYKTFTVAFKRLKRHLKRWRIPEAKFGFCQTLIHPLKGFPSSDGENSGHVIGTGFYRWAAASVLFCYLLRDWILIFHFFVNFRWRGNQATLFWPDTSDQPLKEQPIPYGPSEQ